MNNGYQPKKTRNETPPAPPTSGSTFQKAVFRAFEKLIIEGTGKEIEVDVGEIGQKSFLEEYEMNEFDAYEEVADFLLEWCRKNELVDLIVTLKIDGVIQNEVLEWNTGKDICASWSSDWWEGQDSVELIGFTPMYEVLPKYKCNKIFSGVKK